MNAKPNTDLKRSPDRAAKAKVVAAAEAAETNLPIAEALAAFTMQTRAEDIPAEVRTRAVHHMLDAAGIAVAASRYDFSHRMLTGIRGLAGEGPVPVIGMPARLPARDAAMMNGFLCHGLDFDDTHVAAIVHPTASILPTVLSAGAMTGASGRDMVAAFVIGVETAVRIGMVAKSGFHQVGFHPTGMVGVFGCTLAAGRLMGLNDAELRNAQGIALSMASGSLEFVADGAWNKRLHPGWAAHAGITAAALAREGFIGATKPYDGRFGLFPSYLGKESDRADYPIATRGLGDTWELMATAIKPYPACHFTHACIDSALALRPQVGDWRRIKSIETLVPEGVFKTVCEPEAGKLKPANSYDAQFSVQYLTAVALVRGKFGLAEIEPEAISNSDVLALTSKVKYGAYQDGVFPKLYHGEVVITLDDGRTLRHREHVNRGAAERPLTNGEIVEKFNGNAARGFDRDTARRMEAAMLGLEKASNVDGVFAAFSPRLR
ncbi:MAG TPA: MmgE/PrpD family protein [Hyphomicrobiaceae bacterium]|nr:MmgE/PrpD family protein [Hyphomicrobiaceae bacterium]